jgi:hypothetical protein
LAGSALAASRNGGLASAATLTNGAAGCGPGCSGGEGHHRKAATVRFGRSASPARAAMRMRGEMPKSGKDRAEGSARGAGAGSEDCGRGAKR